MNQFYDVVQRNEVAPDRQGDEEKAALQTGLIEGDALAAQQHDRDDSEAQQRDTRRTDSRRDGLAARMARAVPRLK